MKYQINNVFIDFYQNMVVYPGGREVEMSSAESNILKALIEDENIICSKGKLEEIGWEGRPVSASNLSVAITSLRKKIEHIDGFYIKNMPRKGYFLSTKPGTMIIPLSDNFDASISKVEPLEELGLIGELNKTNKGKAFYIINTFFVTLLITLFIFLLMYRTPFACYTKEQKTVCMSDGVDNVNLSRYFESINSNQTLIASSFQTVVLNQKSGVILHYEHHE